MVVLGAAPQYSPSLLNYPEAEDEVKRVAKELWGVVDGKLNYPESVDRQLLTAPWRIKFDAAKQGPAKPVMLDNLQDWSANSNDSIRYYSGTAVYRTNFDLSGLHKDRRTILNLGNVKSMATVK